VHSVFLSCFGNETWKMLRGLEHAHGQQQRYNCAASRAIRNSSCAAVSLHHRIYKGESETVSGRMFSLHEALESPAADIRGESRAIVLDHEFR
jgi:hypothetical protein